MTKYLKYFAAIIFVVAAIYVAKISLFPTVAGDKAIEITIVNKVTEEELYSKTLHTDAETLGELLDETTDLTVVYQSSDFGRYIISILGVEQGTVNEGPWWLYESSNNEVCATAGYCPGVDDLPIMDEDNFTFNYTDTF